MNRVLVVGLGTFGSTVATAFQELGYEVTALDVDGDKVHRLAATVARPVVGDGTEIEVLEQVGAGAVDSAVVSTGHDMTASVLCALCLRDLGVNKVWVKVISEIHARIIEKVGAAETVFPERESAALLAKRMVSHSILNYVELGPGFSVQEMAVPASWLGRSLRELELPRRYGVSAIAVRDYLTDQVRPVPDPDARLKDSDALLLTGRDESLARVAAVA